MTTIIYFIRHAEIGKEIVELETNRLRKLLNTANQLGFGGDSYDKKYISKDDYANYITLFEDSGWKHISGSRWGGLHYFQKIKPETSSEIFSDQES
ncbi:DUF2812 domain-containing protein, partial [Streptococcus agalactiae]|uniref:DUF2812 domain-containing protein n=1 Tax=Streptococcus agalactiae TaxID=1311 RepID=UPI00362A27C3